VSDGVEARQQDPARVLLAPHDRADADEDDADRRGHESDPARGREHGGDRGFVTGGLLHGDLHGAEVSQAVEHHEHREVERVAAEVLRREVMREQDQREERARGAPEPAEHEIFLKRAAGVANHDGRNAHADIDDRGRDPGAEQIEPW